MEFQFDEEEKMYVYVSDFSLQSDILKASWTKWHVNIIVNVMDDLFAFQ